MKEEEKKGREKEKEGERERERRRDLLRREQMLLRNKENE